jgi:REP element-mobilizing transposase RayT
LTPKRRLAPFVHKPTAWRSRYPSLILTNSPKGYLLQKTVDEPASPLDDFLIGEDEDDLEIPSISSILYDVPPPRPAISVPADTPALSSQPVSEGEESEEEPEIEYPSSVVETRPSAAAHFSRESSPAIPLHQLFRSDQKPKVETLAETRPSQVPAELETTAPSKARRPVSPLQPPTSQELGETRPSSTNDLAQNRALEPISPGLYNLTYACLLVPRLSSHYLAGDLAELLSTWMPEICISFGWRLEFLTVRPEYLQWVVNVPPSSSPGYLMRIIRQQTSERIFANFPRLKKENPSGDFWAPGYLIMGGDPAAPAATGQRLHQPDSPASGDFAPASTPLKTHRSTTRISHAAHALPD